MHDIDYEEDYYGDVDAFFKAIHRNDFDTADTIVMEGIPLDTEQVYSNLSLGDKGINELKYIWSKYDFENHINDLDGSRSALEIAVDNDNPAVVEFLYERGARITTGAYLLAISQRNFEMVDLLLSLNKRTFNSDDFYIQSLWNDLDDHNKDELSMILADHGIVSL